MKNELYTLFYSPIAWLVLIIFAFQAGMAFSDAYLDQLRQQALDYSLYGVTRRFYSVGTELSLVCNDNSISTSRYLRWGL